jgi:hypothetical protein
MVQPATHSALAVIRPPAAAVPVARVTLAVAPKYQNSLLVLSAAQKTYGDLRATRHLPGPRIRDLRQNSPPDTRRRAQVAGCVERLRRWVRRRFPAPRSCLRGSGIASAPDLVCRRSRPSLNTGDLGC